MKFFFTDDEFQSSYRSSTAKFPDFSLTFDVMDRAPAEVKFIA